MSNQYLYRCKKCDFRVYTDDDGCECTMSGMAFLYKTESILSGVQFPNNTTKTSYYIYYLTY